METTVHLARKWEFWLQLAFHIPYSPGKSLSPALWSVAMLRASQGSWLTVLSMTAGSNARSTWLVRHGSEVNISHFISDSLFQLGVGQVDGEAIPLWPFPNATKRAFSSIPSFLVACQLLDHFVTFSSMPFYSFQQGFDSTFQDNSQTREHPVDEGSSPLNCYAPHNPYRT